MSGIIVNNVARASGTIAATPGGLDWSTAVVTGSTVTVEAGKGYFINTTSNACTVTLPASADPGDQIVLADYARTWATNAVTLDSNGLTLQGEADTYIVTYDTAGQSVNLVYSDSTKVHTLDRGSMYIYIITSQQHLDFIFQVHSRP